MQFGGRFRIERELGRGAMATVFLAIDEKHSRRVALKVLRPEVAWPGAAERFHREIQLAARLAHPNIVPLFDSGDADGTLYFVMQYVEGAETLRERLVRDGVLPLAEAAGLSRDIAAAMDYAHRQGVIHRDLKPENILLAEGRALVLDFGIARALSRGRSDRTTEVGLAIGTPAYMSPEQASASPDVGPASDLYGLGCVMYEMLSGRPPFVASSPQQVLVQHMQEVPGSLTGLRADTPPALAALVERLLEKDPADRPTHASQVLAALDAVPPARRPGASAAWTGGALLLGALAVWLGTRQFPATTSEDTEPDPAEVAVLYLAADDSALRPLATGLTEALIDRLSRVDGLRVRSADAVRSFRDLPVAVDSVALRLGVGTIVSGEVRGVADAPRLSVRLLAADGTQLDARTLRDTSGAPLGLEQELAEEVANFLRPRLGRTIILRARRAGTTSDRAWLLLQRGEASGVQAQELLLRGDTLAASRLARDADSLLAAAASADPRWPDPLVVRARLAARRHEFIRDSARRAEIIATGLEQVRAALAREPGHLEALEWRGVLRALAARGARPPDSLELDRAISDLRAGAVPENAHEARALSNLSLVLMDRGRWQEAKLAAQEAYERDAFLEHADRVLNDLYHTSLYLQQWPEASRWCETGRARLPGAWLFAFCGLALELMPTGAPPNPDLAWKLVAALDTLAPVAEQVPARWRMMAAAVVARAGLRDSAERSIARARALAPTEPDLDFYEAAAVVQLNEPARAMRLLRELVRRDPGIAAGLRADPAFKALAGNPEFESLGR